MFARAPAIGLTVLALLLPPVVSADESPSIPVAGTLDRVFEGYDWEARAPFVAHVVKSARPFVSTIDLGEIDTGALDLEVCDLMPFRTYRIAGPDLPQTSRSDERGCAVFWTIPAEPGEWTVFTEWAPEATTTIVLTPRSVSIPMAFCPWCPWEQPPPRAKPPRPTGSEYGESGLVVEQAAYSFTEGVLVKVTNEWTHSVKVSAVVSGEMAGAEATAGGDISETVAETWEVASRGQGVEFRTNWDFRKDTYEDGSYKVYATSRGQNSRIMPISWSLPPPDDARRVTIGAVGEIQAVERGQANAGGVYYGVGVKAFGVGAKVTLTATDAAKGVIRMEFTPPAAGNTTYAYKFVNGDGNNTGLIGMAWRVD